MALISITLDETQQHFLLATCGYIDKVPEGKRKFPAGTTKSIAEMILRAQEDLWAADFNIPDPGARDLCGLCWVPKDTHDQPDHDWQWLKPRE